MSSQILIFRSIKAALTSPRAAVSAGMGRVYQHVSGGNKDLADRFCNRFRAQAIIVWGLQYSVVLIWLGFVLTDNLPAFVYSALNYYPPASGLRWGVWVVGIVCFFLVIPGLFVIIANGIVVYYIKIKCDMHLVNNLCLSCGYPLPDAAPGDGGAVTCPECGQRYVQRETPEQSSPEPGAGET